MDSERDVGASAQTYEVGAHFEALIEGVLMAPLDSRYTQVGFHLISAQVCAGLLTSWFSLCFDLM